MLDNLLYVLANMPPHAQSYDWGNGMGLDEIFNF